MSAAPVIQGPIAVPLAPLPEQIAVPHIIEEHAGSFPLPPPYTGPQPPATPTSPNVTPAGPDSINVNMSQPVSISGSSNEINITVPMETLLANILGSVTNSMAISMHSRQQNSRSVGCGGIQMTVHCPISINGDGNIVSLESNAPNVVYLPVPVPSNRVMAAAPSLHQQALRFQQAYNPAQHQREQQQQQQQRRNSTPLPNALPNHNPAAAYPLAGVTTPIDGRKRKADDAVVDRAFLPKLKKIQIQKPEPAREPTVNLGNEVVEVTLEPKAENGGDEDDEVLN